MKHHPVAPRSGKHGGSTHYVSYRHRHETSTLHLTEALSLCWSFHELLHHVRGRSHGDPWRGGGGGGGGDQVAMVTIKPSKGLI